MTLEALKGEEMVSWFAGHPTMIHQWKRAQIEGPASVFVRGGRKSMKNRSKTCTPRLGSWPSPTIYCKQAQTQDRQVRRKIIEPNLPDLSVGKQCALLSISRSSFYYEPKGETEKNLDRMRLIDKLFEVALLFWTVLRLRKDVIWLVSCRLLVSFCVKECVVWGSLVESGVRSLRVVEADPIFDHPVNKRAILTP